MPSAKCPQCATVVTYAAGFDPICPKCGFSGTAPRAAPAFTPAPAPASVPATAAPTARPAPSQAIAIVALVLNLVIVPGLGTLVGGRIGEGLAQLGLLVFGVLLIFTILLIPISIVCFIAAWVWGIVSGIQLITAASQSPPAAPVA